MDSPVVDDTAAAEAGPSPVREEVRARPTGAPAHRLTVPGETDVAPPDARWSRGRVVAASVAAFAVGVAATTVGVLAVQRAGDGSGQNGPTATSTAVGDLRPLTGQRVSGSARVIRDTAGRQVRITLDAGSAVTGPGFVQAWLLDPRTKQMVALGVLDGRRGTFVVPAALDLGAYDAVDLSLEPYDGNPAHSAVSLARGQLRPT